MAKNEDKYTHPQMREEIKEQIKADDKGGKKGQWSARKSQLLTQTYEKRGGGYQGEKDQDQRNLEKWTDEEWQTQEGKANAREGDETARYLPKKAWERLSEDEKSETEEKKRAGSREGEQFVSNTREARNARRDSQSLPLNGYDELSVDSIQKKLRGLSSDEINQILEYEKNHENRKTLVATLEKRL